jgi:hypothetical protein
MATNTSVVCRQGYGAARYYASLPGTNDALTFMFLQAGHEDDDILRDYDYLSQVLTVAQNKECTATNYVRKTITSGATVTLDNTNNRVDVGLPSVTWAALGAMTGTNAQQQVAALLVCYQANVSSGTDATLQVLTKHYYPFVADGSDRIVPFPSGFYRAAG